MQVLLVRYYFLNQNSPRYYEIGTYMPQRSVRFLVSGRVQGVWFRFGTQLAAQKLGVLGYVRNLPTGQVECLAQGNESAVDALIGWAHSGTPFARVESVTVEEIDVTEQFTKFEIR